MSIAVVRSARPPAPANRGARGRGASRRLFSSCPANDVFHLTGDALHLPRHFGGREPDALGFASNGRSRSPDRPARLPRPRVVEPDPAAAITTAVTAKPTMPAPIRAAETGCCLTDSTAFEPTSFTPPAVRPMRPTTGRRPLACERDERRP